MNLPRAKVDLSELPQAASIFHPKTKTPNIDSIGISWIAIQGF